MKISDNQNRESDTMQVLYNRRRELKRAVKEVEKQIRETEDASRTETVSNQAQ